MMQINGAIREVKDYRRLVPKSKAGPYLSEKECPAKAATGLSGEAGNKIRYLRGEEYEALCRESIV